MGESVPVPGNRCSPGETFEFTASGFPVKLISAASSKLRTYAQPQWKAADLSDKAGMLWADEGLRGQIKGKGGDPHYRTQACRDNCGGTRRPFSFELLKNGEYVLEQPAWGALPLQCTAPAN
eukprot:gene6343-7603_t